MPDRLRVRALGLSDQLVTRLATACDVIAGTPGVPSDASLVISMFPDDAALVSATATTEGVLSSLPAGALHVTTGVHGRGTIEGVAHQHERRGCRLVAAPRLLASAPGQGAVTVLGGDANARARVQPMFDVMGVAVVATCERPEDAALLAIAHSAMLACAMEAIAEAFALVRKFDVDAGLLRDVMSDALFAGTVYGPLANAMLSDVSDTLPSASRGVQLLDLALDAATGARVPLASVDACRDRLLSAIARGEGGRAWTVVASEQARASGLEHS